MNKFILSFLILTPTSLLAQDQNLFMGLQFSLDHIGSENYIVSDGNINGYIISRPESNFKVGLAVSWSIMEQINLNTGISYSNKDFSGTYNCATCDLIGDPLPVTINHRYVTVPIDMEYKILKGRVSPSVILGLANNFIIQQEKIEAREYLLEGVLGVGMNFELSENLRLTSRYRYAKALTDVYLNENNSPNDLKTNTLEIGINYKIK